MPTVNKLHEIDVTALGGEVTHPVNTSLLREFPFLDGVRQPNALGYLVSPKGHDFLIFVVVDSETDRLPNTGARAFCAQSWLEQCDNEVKEVETFYGQTIDAAC